MRKLIIGMSILCLSWCCFVAPVDATEPAELDVVTDAYIMDISISGNLDGNPDNMLNTNAVLPGTGTFSSGAAVDSRGIMVFDIGAFSGEKLKSATLVGWGYRSDHIEDGDIDVQVAAYAGDGQITLADFDEDASDVGTFTFPTTESIFDPVYYQFEVDATSFVQQLLLDAENFVEFRLTSDELSAYIAAGDSLIQLDMNAPGYPKLILNFSSTGWVKVEVPDGASGIQLLVDYDQDTEYDRFFIQGVGYSPVPIGRAGMQWGATNIYDDEEILHRDFQLLSDMNANTIRIWKADNTNNGSNEFPNFITVKTLDLAEGYELKVIPGFWIEFDGYWHCTAEGREFVWSQSFFDIANDRIFPSVHDDILTRWRAFVTEFKDHPAILFWSIGNENNYQLGNDNEALVNAFYELINDMAIEAHAIDPNHPVAFVNGGIEVPLIVDQGNGPEEINALPNIISTVASDIDIWGVNIYPGQTFGNFFEEFHTNIAAGLPLWVSEFGIDAWHSDKLDQDGGYEDQTAQAAWDGVLWDEIVDAANQDLGVLGGTLMSYADEWWKPYQWMCQVSGWQQWWRPWWEFLNSNDGTYSCGVFNATHDLYGIPPADSTCDGANDWFPSTPDNFFNEEWWGIMAVQKNLTAGKPDVMIPREVYGVLQQKFLNGLNLGPIIDDINPDNGFASDVVVISGRNFGDYQGDANYDPALDLNGDGTVDRSDFNIFYASYNRRSDQAGFNPDADFNHDAIVDYSDFSIFIQSYRASSGNTYVNLYPLIGPSAKIISWTDTEIQCEVPFGAQTGAVTVYTNIGDSNSVLFTVQDVTPVIDTFYPVNGQIGTQVTIVGSNFGVHDGSLNYNPEADFSGDGIVNFVDYAVFSGQMGMSAQGLSADLDHDGDVDSDDLSIFNVPWLASRGSKYIEFYDGKIAKIISWSDTEIVCEVPYGAEIGDVFFVTNIQRINIGAFKVDRLPVITGLSADSTAREISFEIYGEGFGEYVGVGNYEPRADFDKNLNINYGDFLVWYESYKSSRGEDRYSEQADFNHDGIVNFDDFSIFLRSYRASRGDNYVVFSNGVEARIEKWTDTFIICNVPFSAETGEVYVAADAVQSNGRVVEIW